MLLKDFKLRLLSLFQCLLVIFQQLCFVSVSAQETGASTNSAAAMQAADILQIRSEVERILSLQQQNNGDSDEALALKALVLRRLVSGFLDIRRACNKTEIELAYTYEVLAREQAKQAEANRLLTLTQFSQFSALYTIGPYSRDQKKFKQSAICTCISSFDGVTLATSGIIYNKHHKAGNTAPPKFVNDSLDGGPVDANSMPDSVERFLDSPRAGASVSRKQELFALWKKRCGVDASIRAALCSLEGDSRKPFAVLNKRIVLLWSLHNAIEGFDDELLALVNLVRSHNAVSPISSESLASLGLNPAAIEASTLLKNQSTVAGLIRANQINGNTRQRDALEIQVLEDILSGMLVMRDATDKIDEELNYAYDVVLSGLVNSRRKGLLLNYECSFIQNGIFSALAGFLFLREQGKAAHEMFLIQAPISIMLASLAVRQMRGGSRKIDTPPNSLANFLDLGNGAYKFDPLIIDFLNTPSFENKKLTRKQLILEKWKERKVSALNIDNPKNQAKLAAMPSVKRDTIAIVRNRIPLLHSLKARLEEFDYDLSSLLEATAPTAPANPGTLATDAKILSPHAIGVAKILDVKSHAEYLHVQSSAKTTRAELLPEQLFVTRRVMSAMLDVRKAVDTIDLQIAKEFTARDRLVSQRDFMVTATNNANFYQIGILSLVSNGPLSLINHPGYPLASNHVNIVSGYMVGGLAAATVVERQIGFRKGPAPPNAIGAAMGLPNLESQLSPTIVEFMKAVPPNSLDGKTRREELIRYWQSNSTNVDVSKQSTLEKYAASGPAHSGFDERIKLMSKRINMLYDVRAVIDIMSVGLGDLLRDID